MTQWETFSHVGENQIEVGWGVSVKGEWYKENRFQELWQNEEEV